MKKHKRKVVLKFSSKKGLGIPLICIIGILTIIIVYLTLTVYADTLKEDSVGASSTVGTISTVDFKSAVGGINYLNYPSHIIVEPTVYADWTEETTTDEPTTETPTETTTENQIVRPINGYDITRRSGFTEEEFNEIINRTLSNVGHTDSAFYNAGEALKDIEDTYNINGLFILGIASEESAWGCYGPAKNRQNFTGMGPIKGRPSSNGRAIFTSVYDCFWNTSRNLRENYMNSGLTSLYSIGYKYCPPTADDWADNVYSHMSRYRNSAIQLYGEDIFE
jgi:hypothetical protein